MGNMETERLYYTWISSAPFEAVILELRPASDGKAHIILDKTIFYPEGGGQPADRGTVNGVPLLDVREKDGEILHVVSAAGAEILKTGPAKLILDAARRREFTSLHTGQHLLSGTILRLTGKPTVSMHLGDETCTIDVDTPEINEETVIQIEETVADAIEENHPVVIHLCPPEDVSSFPLRKVPPQGEEVIRVVEIEGNDFSPCCGTHLKSSGEIGMLRILGAEKYKGMTRVTFIAGRRVLRDSRLLRRNANIVSHSLKVPVNETGKGVLELLEKTAQTESRLKTLEEEAARIKAGELLKKAALRKTVETSGPAVIIESYAGASISEVLNIGRAAQKETDAVLVLASEPDMKFAAFCTAKGFDIRPLFKDTFAAHGGRGGGGPSFFQGSFEKKETLAAFLEDLKKKLAED
jgi:alanyl-tRNA synthetase